MLREIKTKYRTWNILPVSNILPLLIWLNCTRIENVKVAVSKALPRKVTNGLDQILEELG
jgi:hypothetical protein